MISKQIKWMIWIGTLAVLMGAAVMMVLFVWLPTHLESKVIPEVIQKFGLDARQVRIRRIGWLGAEMGPIRIDGDNMPAFRMASVHIDYSPLSLLRGRIKTITLGGVRVMLLAGPKGFSLPGLKPAAKTRSAESPSPLPDMDSLIPVGIENISLHQSEIVIDHQGRRIVVSVDMDLACGNLNKGVLAAHGDIAVLGSTLTIAGHLDQSANAATLRIEKSHLFLGLLAQVMNLPPYLSVSANASLKGSLRLQLDPYQITSLSLTGQLEETRMGTPQASVENLVTPAGIPQPIAFTLQRAHSQTIQWRFGPLQIQGPLKIQIDQAAGNWEPTASGWVLNADIATSAPAQTMIHGLKSLSATALHWQAQVRQTETNAIQYHVKTMDHPPLALALPPVQVAMADYRIDVQGGYEKQLLKAHSNISTEQIQITLPDMQMVVPKATFSSTFTLQQKDPAPDSQFSAHTLLSDVRIQQGDARFQLPDVEITANGNRSSQQPWQYRLNFQTNGASYDDPAKGLKIYGIGLHLPMDWPPAANPQSGQLNIRTIQLYRHHLGGLMGHIRQKEKALTLSLRHQSKLFAGLNVLVNGSIDSSGGTLTANLPAHQFIDEVDVGRFLPDARGVWVKGQIEGGAAFVLNHGNLQGSAFLTLKEGNVRQNEDQFAIEGIDASIQMDDLIQMTSKPRQTLTVNRIRSGHLTATNLEVDFQLESGSILFIEKARLQWCRGRIAAGALRLAPGRQDYGVTLFCDRLNLAMVLEQLGVGQASGNGTVNGTIPVYWQNGRLSFDKGFLYSTPGEPGVLRLSGTDKLLAGLPPDTPQHTQVDIATEALKDYSYQWAKLHMESDADSLLLQLQLDGKPNRLLPFAFDQELGRLIRVAGQGQADFKGIRIDLNFNSPIDQLLRYKEFITPNP